MSKRKKMIIGALILTLAVVVGIGATTVCGSRGSWARGFGPGFHGMGCHPGPHGEDIADFIMWKMDRHVKDLNLTDAQKLEYEKSKEQIRAAVAEVKTAMTPSPSDLTTMPSTATTARPVVR